jgi:GntR family transcriptional regulator
MRAAVLDGAGSLQQQVRRAILREIADGRYAIGAQLPTEKEYAERQGVSLITVRNALASLVQAGYIERSSGRGTFVSAPKLTYEIRLMSSSTDSLRAAGIAFEIEVVTADLTRATDEVCLALGLTKGAKVFQLERVVWIREEPAILLNSWIRRTAARALVHEPAFASGSSLYALLAQEGIKLAHADGRLELAYANDHESSLLRLLFGAPLFAYESIVHDDKGRTIERARALYDANRFSLTLPAEAPTQ